jgi:putative endopeptidase
VLLDDTHALSYLRVNVNVQMVDEFYEAFDVREGDGMYVKPEERLKTWGK